MAVEFNSLPDSMESEELAGYFRQFLDEYGDRPGDLYEMKQLYELAYRQWDTYERVNKELAQQLDDYIISSVNFSYYELMDVLISVVENLSLANSFKYIVEHKDEADNPAVRELIYEAEDEYADTIDDPYGLD